MQFVASNNFTLQDFASAFAKLLALGVPAAAVPIGKPWYQIW